MDDLDKERIWNERAATFLRIIAARSGVDDARAFLAEYPEGERGSIVAAARLEVETRFYDAVAPQPSASFAAVREAYADVSLPDGAIDAVLAAWQALLPRGYTATDTLQQADKAIIFQTRNLARIAVQATLEALQVLPFNTLNESDGASAAPQDSQ